MTDTLYNLANIRDLLLNGFDDRELRQMCFDVPDFRPVYNELARNTGKGDIVDELLAYAERQLLMDTLLALAKEQNPGRYGQHGPYYHADPTSALQEQVSDLPGVAGLLHTMSKSLTLQRIRRYAGWIIVGLLWFVGLIGAIDGALVFITWPVTIVGTASVVLGWTGILYLKRHSIKWRTQNCETPVRRLGIRCALPLAGIVILLWVPHIPIPTSAPLPISPANQSEILVIIAPFDGEEDIRPEIRIENKLIEQLAKLPDSSYVRIERYPEVIEEKNSHIVLSSIRRDYAPTIVVWGWYDSIGITTNFEIYDLDEFPYIQGGYKPTLSEVLRLQSTSDSFTFYIARQMPLEVTFLALFTVGEIYVSERDYYSARVYLEQALDNIPEHMRGGLEDYLVRFVLANVLVWGFDDYDYGMEMCSETMEKFPDYLPPYAFMASLHEIKGIVQYIEENDIAYKIYVDLPSSAVVVETTQEIPLEAQMSAEALRLYSYVIDYCETAPEVASVETSFMEGNIRYILPHLFLRRGIQYYAFGNVEEAVNDMQTAVDRLQPGPVQDQAIQLLESWSTELSDTGG